MAASLAIGLGAGCSGDTDVSCGQAVKRLEECSLDVADVIERLGSCDKSKRCAAECIVGTRCEALRDRTVVDACLAFGETAACESST